jgi:hypothetical protein
MTIALGEIRIIDMQVPILPASTFIITDHFENLRKNSEGGLTK